MTGPSQIPVGLVAVWRWLGLPAEIRREAWQLARAERPHPDPVVQVLAVGWHRTWARLGVFLGVPVAMLWVLMVTPRSWEEAVIQDRYPTMGYLYVYFLVWVGVHWWTLRRGVLAAPNLWALAAARSDKPDRIKVVANGIVNAALLPILTVSGVGYTYELLQAAPDRDPWALAVIATVIGVGAVLLALFWLWYFGVPDPTRLLPGRTAVIVDETGLRFPCWKLHVPWDQVTGWSMAWRSGSGRILGLAFQVRDLEAVWAASGLGPRRRRWASSGMRHTANWMFIPAWTLRGRIEDPMTVVIRHYKP